MNTEWHDEYVIGHPEIDQDHRTLIGILAVLSKGYCDSDLVDTRIKTLELYVNVHFAREERLMRRSGFPDLNQHMAMHEAFRARVRRMREQWAAGDTSQLQEDIVAQLSRWLVDHIQGADRTYIPWLPQA